MKNFSLWFVQCTQAKWSICSASFFNGQSLIPAKSMMRNTYFQKSSQRYEDPIFAKPLAYPLLDDIKLGQFHWTKNICNTGGLWSPKSVKPFLIYCFQSELRHFDTRPCYMDTLATFRYNWLISNDQSSNWPFTWALQLKINTIWEYARGLWWPISGISAWGHRYSSRTTCLFGKLSTI